MTEFASVLDDAVHWPVSFQKGHVIYEENETPKAMYRVERGCVRLQVNGSNGDRQVIAFLFPGDVFGFSLDRRTTSAESVTDVELARYSLQSVLDLSTRSREVTVGLLNSANALYGDLARHVDQITHLSAMERVLWFLHWLMRHQDTPKSAEAVMLPMSRRDIGDYLGLAPETLSRAFKQLRTKGYVTLHGRRGFTLKPPAFAFHVSDFSEFSVVHPAA